MSYIAGGSKFPFKCKGCNVTFPTGADFWYRGKGKGGRCRGCQEATEAAPREQSPYVTPAPVERPYVAPTASRGKIVREFASYAEYVATADACERDDFCSSTDRTRPEWHGTANFSEAKKLATEGWSAIRSEVDALVENVEHTILPSLQPAFTNYFDVSGGIVDVGRFLDGEPECMVETKLVEIAKPGKVVTVLVQGFYSASSDENQIKARGAAVVALIDAIERMQHSTEIYVEYTFKKIAHLVKVKGASESLDIDLLMFILAHPSAYRRISFGVQEGEASGLGCGPSGNYGKPMDLSQVERVGASITLDTLRYDTPMMDSKVWIREQLVKVGLIREEIQ